MYKSPSLREPVRMIGSFGGHLDASVTGARYDRTLAQLDAVARSGAHAACSQHGSGFGLVETDEPLRTHF